MEGPKFAFFKGSFWTFEGGGWEAPHVIVKQGLLITS